jgi:hypothetical protein
MHTDYSFLKDELALIEIRKHQWSESRAEVVVGSIEKT